MTEIVNNCRNCRNTRTLCTKCFRYYCITCNTPSTPQLLIGEHCCIACNQPLPKCCACTYVVNTSNGPCVLLCDECKCTYLCCLRCHKSIDLYKCPICDVSS